MDYMLIAVTVVLCAISFWLLIRTDDNYIDKKKLVLKKDKENKDNEKLEKEINGNVQEGEAIAKAEEEKVEEEKAEEIAVVEDVTLEKETSEDNAAAGLPKGMLVYSGLMVLITIGIAVTLITVYEDNTIWTNLKCVTLLCVMWPLAYIDFKTYRIPNEFIIFGLICRAGILAFEMFLATASIFEIVIPELIAAGALLLAAVLCRLCMKGSIGYGDIKLFVVMGVFLGMNGIWSAIFTSLIVSFFMAVYVLATKKKSRKDVVPFGPALVIGTYVSIFLSGV